MKLLRTIADLLFPRSCFVCGAEGEWLCPACVPKMRLAASDTCLVCGAITTHGEVCLECSKQSNLDGLTTFAYYQSTPGIAAFIHALKYRRAYDVAQALPIIWECGASESALVELETLRQAVVVPVPLYKARERERGFNQSFFIAKSLAVFLKLEVFEKGLVRQKKTAQQVTLSKTERAENMQGAFKWVGESVPKATILVDDVFTTGSTMQAAAVALKEAGVKVIWGVAVARD